MKYSKLFLLTAALFLSAGQLLFAKPKTQGQPKSSAKIESTVNIQSYSPQMNSAFNKQIPYAENGYYQEALAVITQADENGFIPLESGKDDFINRQNSAAKEKLNAYFKNLGILINRFNNLQSDIGQFKYTTQEGQNLDSSKTFTQLVETRNRIYSDGKKLKLIASGPFITQTERYVFGVNESPYSGILGTIDAQIASILEKEKDAATASIGKDFDEVSKILAKKEFSAKDFTSQKDNAKKNLENVKSNTELCVNINRYYQELTGTRIQNQQNLKFAQMAKSIVQLTQDASDFLETKDSFYKELERNPKPEGDIVQSFRNRNETHSQELVSMAQNFTAINRSATQLRKSPAANTVNALAAQDSIWKKFVSDYQSSAAYIETASTSNAIRLWVAAADYFKDSGSLIVESDKKVLSEAAGNIAENGETLHPTKALGILETFSETIADDILILQNCKSRLNDGYIYRANFINQQTDLDRSISYLTQIEKESIAVKEKARTLKITSQVAADEINVYTTRAQSYFAQNNFSMTHENINRALKTYNLQLENLRQDYDLQIAAYTAISELKEKVAEKEKPYLIQQVRSLKNSARESYYAGDFENAGSILSQAESMRSEFEKLTDSQLEQDIELEKLKNYVNTALSIKEGRDISPYDAKAPEMNQNISIATKYFTQGSAIISTDRERGRHLLIQARDKINQVKIYYPRNKEASSLTLRIEQMIDPELFNQNFNAKFSQIKSTDFTAKDPVASQAYSDLLDLAEIRPEYPGIKELIYKAEIDLELRQRPVNKANLSRAQDYANQAKKLLENAGRDELLLRQVKDTAQKALDINPQNSDAITVLDQVALRTGQQSAVVLSPADEELYQKALTDLQNNNIFSANEKLQKLISNKSNLRSAKVIKLQKRIEAKL